MERSREASPSMRAATADSRAEILIAAADCFREQGYSATSIDDVARKLSATKGMIYHHFRSKTDLFFAVYRRGMEINFEAVQPHADGGGSANSHLGRMAMAHAVVLMAQQAFQRVLAQGVAMHQQGSTTAAQRETLVELIDIRNSYETMFRTAIEAALDEAGVAEADLSLASKSFLAVLNSTVFWYHPRDDDPHLEQEALARELVIYAMRGLGLECSEDALSQMEL